MIPGRTSHDTPARPAQPAGEIHVRTPSLRRLFDPMDASPVAQKDLLPSVSEFIVSWGREIPAGVPPALVVHVAEPASADDAWLATAGVHAFFESQAALGRRALRRMFREGRVNLLIALVVFGLAVVGGEALRSTGSTLGNTVGSMLELGGWVAMWRPMQTFLYDWWPIRADIQLFLRLAAMDVRVVCERGP